MSTTARLSSIVLNRNGGRAVQHGQDSSHAMGGRPPHTGQREESHHFFGPNHSDNTLPMLIDMGFHKYASMTTSIPHMNTKNQLCVYGCILVSLSTSSPQTLVSANDFPS